MKKLTYRIEYNKDTKQWATVSGNDYASAMMSAYSTTFEYEDDKLVRLEINRVYLLSDFYGLHRYWNELTKPDLDIDSDIKEFKIEKIDEKSIGEYDDYLQNRNGKRCKQLGYSSPMEYKLFANDGDRYVSQFTPTGKTEIDAIKNMFIDNPEEFNVKGVYLFCAYKTKKTSKPYKTMHKWYKVIYHGDIQQ